MFIQNKCPEFDGKQTPQTHKKPSFKIAAFFCGFQIYESLIISLK